MKQIYVVAAGVLLAAAAMGAGQAVATKNATTQDEPVKVEEREAAIVNIYEVRENRFDDALEDLAADNDPEKSVYISALQLVKIERDRGDAKKAIPYLEALANRAPTQTLRSAVRRLIADIYLEDTDYTNIKSAEKELQRIVDENLLQL